MAERSCRQVQVATNCNPATQVLYLAVTSFLDKRTEDEERKKFEAAQKDRCARSHHTISGRLACDKSASGVVLGHAQGAAAGHGRRKGPKAEEDGRRAHTRGRTGVWAIASGLCALNPWGS